MGLGLSHLMCKTSSVDAYIVPIKPDDRFTFKTTSLGMLNTSPAGSEETPTVALVTSHSASPLMKMDQKTTEAEFGRILAWFSGAPALRQILVPLECCPRHLFRRSSHDGQTVLTCHSGSQFEDEQGNNPVGVWHASDSTPKWARCRNCSD